MFEGFLFSPVDRDLDLIPLGMPNDKEAIWLEDGREVEIVYCFLSDRLASEPDIFVTIWRVGHNEIKGFFLILKSLCMGKSITSYNLKGS